MNLCNIDNPPNYDGYATAKPFPHAVIDGFFEPEPLRAAAKEIMAIPADRWMRRDHDDQVGKLWIQDPYSLPPVTRDLLLLMNTEPFVKWLEHLTGIGGLMPDIAYEGGGVHKVLPGGRLEVHADFNLHPATGRHRRLNVLLYLNEDWKDEWAPLELWKADMTECAEKIPALFNRLVVFSTTDKALHGHPHPLECPADRACLALALYYYSDDRPEEEKAAFHWADWKKRPV